MYKSIKNPILNPDGSVEAQFILVDNYGPVCRWVKKPSGQWEWTNSCFTSPMNECGKQTIKDLESFLASQAPALESLY